MRINNIFSQRTKLIRIPETITFKNADEANGALVIATEYVEPLSKKLSDLSVDEKIAGLHNIVVSRIDSDLKSHILDPDAIMLLESPRLRTHEGKSDHRTQERLHQFHFCKSCGFQYVPHYSLEISTNEQSIADWKLGGFELSATVTENVGTSDVKYVSENATSFPLTFFQTISRSY